ncbi:tetratricopeptide repeat protein [Luteolibacter ambystomatis]|uniref:Tetratricopeptide repeat protein n=1 Tax=Luteolibacter ambystomatis TaxID=2824561 RepID=A0A975PG88_9BACT|nr:tetratricopeptide repeat protein [Luteolibacter ambystomatis]QUE52092.1 tetratricopeptide repeat protein [Luteolibacter ambystomatis]
MLFAQTPAPNPAPGTALDVNQLNTLYDKAAKALSGEKPNYEEAIAALETIVNSQIGKNPGPAAGLIEQLRFNLGIAYMSLGKYTEAEKAFAECYKQFPKGEFASRCQLGIGRARIATGTEVSRAAAVDPLKIAAADPKYRSQAGLALAQLYTDLNKKDEALKVFSSLMGSDIRTPDQTIAAVEVIGLLADADKLDDLIAYLDRLIRQPGVRDTLAWYTNQVLVTADELAAKGKYDAALVIYRSVLPRAQILQIQRDALEVMRKESTRLQALATAQEKLPPTQRGNTAEVLGTLKTAIDTTDKALAEVEKYTDLDAMLLMKRGRCLFYLKRSEEALVCFRTIRLKYKTAKDMKAAAYAEIAQLADLKRTSEIIKLVKEYLAKFPDADNVEAMFGIAGQQMMDESDWKGAYEWFKEAEEKFPNSKELERYIFFQGASLMSDGQFSESAMTHARQLQKFPTGTLAEDAQYRIAMCYFLTNDYKNTLKACQAYLDKFPGGKYTGDILYRLCFIDFQGKEDKADEILQTLGTYVENHKDDAAAPFMYNLIGDVWTQKKIGVKEAPDMALQYYLKAVAAASGKDYAQDALRYAMGQASQLLRDKKDFKQLGELHGEFIKKYPNSPLAMESVVELVGIMMRNKEPEKAAEYLGEVLKSRIGDPASEQAEMLIDTLLKALIPRIRQPKPEEIDAIEQKVVDELKKIIGTNENPTTNARVYYARANVRYKFKDIAKGDLYINGIATGSKPEDLSPQLLYVCGGVLLKMGELDKAEEMFKRLRDRYQASFFSDAGPVGLGQVALARKQYEEALKLFDDALSNPNSSRLLEAMAGKTQALIELKKLDDAEKLGLDVIKDKAAPKPLVAYLYLDLARLARIRAANAVGQPKEDALNTANFRYQRVITGYKIVPDAVGQAYIGSYEVTKERGNIEDANKLLEMLLADPKLEKTESAKKARQLLGK